MYLKPPTLALAAAVIAFLGNPAKADNFFFSFTNTLANVEGTVTGEIFGLTDNSTSAATSIVILTQPLGLDGHSLTPTTWQSVTANTFIETSGVITAADFDANDVTYFSDQPPDFVLLHLGNLGAPNSGILEEIRPDSGGAAEAVVGPVTFTNAPESSSAIPLSTMLLAIALLARKRTAEGA